ncbi:MAG: zinc ABC transporter substrate-binding protein [Gammaproteobacteria bacterium]|nr:MAG: zinc ABC transporter substrate-binding protein [Gammaproteobacteria bacterium]
MTAIKKLALICSALITSAIISSQVNIASANINVFTCEPEWQALAQELGGDKVTTFSATTGMQDPHQVQARPSLISKMRNADLLVCSGAGLEVGWLPVLLRRASNAKIAINKPGYFFAANHVKLLGVPKVIDRSQGDVHAAGNPHVQTNPKNIALVAKALVKRMKTIDPNNASYYQNQTDNFLQRWKQALRKWKKQIRPLKGTRIIVQHASWDYLMDFAKFEQVATIEEKPGIPPTTGHLSDLVKQFKTNPADIIIHAGYQDERASKWLSKRSGIPVVTLPFTLGGSDNAKDLFSLYDDTFNLLTNTLKNKG